MAILSPLEKSKILLSTLLLILVVVSCKPRHVLNIDEVFSLKPSHSISNVAIKSFLESYNAKGMYDEYDDTFVIYVTKSTDAGYKVSVAKVDFPNFRKEATKFEYLQELKGYSKFGKDLVLLYGEIDDSLFSKQSTPKDIMYNEFKGKRATNYEPHFIDYYFKNSPLDAK